MTKQKRKVEWSFDFEDISTRLSEFFNDVIGKDLELETAELAAPRDSATSASVKVDFSVGRANVSALAHDSGNIFEAKITYVGEYEFDVTGTDEKRITLRQKGSFPRGFSKIWGNTEDLVWNITLSQQVEYDLWLKGGVGEADIDLTNLKVNKLKLDTGVGKVNLTLPIQDKSIDVTLKGGIGKTDIVAPAGVSGHLDIQGGVGEVDIVVAPDTAIRVEGDAGLGDIKLPKAFKRIAGEGNFIGNKGIWETPDFAVAREQLIVDYNGGVGSLRIKHFELV